MTTKQSDHPRDDASLPSFVCDALRDAAPELELVLDCWNLLRNVREKYLQKEQKEKLEAYRGRLSRAYYPAFYRDGLRAFAGALSLFTLRRPPSTLADSAGNIDKMGNSFRAFWLDADAKALRDNGCAILVDMPRGESTSRTSEIAEGKAPNLARIERANLLNWDTEEWGGREVIVSCSILEWMKVKANYGYSLEPVYRVINGAEWRVVRLRESLGKWSEEIVLDRDNEELRGNFQGAGGALMEVPPICWYSADGSPIGEGLPELRSVAQLTIDWYGLRSDARELMRKCCLPVPTRKGVKGTGPGGTTPPLVLGGNSIVDLPPDGSFSFAEVEGKSLQIQFAQLEETKRLIDRATMDFLHQPDEAPAKTATQAVLDSAGRQSGLARLAEMKSSAVETVFRIWCEFTGEAAQDNAGIDMDSGAFAEPVTEGKLRLAAELVEKGLLSRRSFVELSARAKVLPPGDTVEDELGRIQEEEREEENRPSPPAPGTNRLGEAAAMRLLRELDQEPEGEVA